MSPKYRRAAFEALELRQLLTAGPLGDLNRDGAVTGADVPAMLGAMTNLSAYQSSNQFSPADLLATADINSDGLVDNSDLQALINAIHAAQSKPPFTPTIWKLTNDTGLSDHDGVTNDAAPTFLGTAEPGVTIQVLEGNAVLASGVADSTGNWSVSVGPLMDGVHSVVARAIGSNGVASENSAAFVITVDTVAPLVAAPQLTPSSDTGASNSDGVTTVTALHFIGTAEAGAVVELKDGNTIIGSGTADSSGSWSITATPLGEGLHIVAARATDVAGNQSAFAALVVTIDTTPPAVSMPDLADSSDDGGSNTDDITSITTPVFNGTAEAGASVELLEGSTVLGSTTADASGNWSITSSVLATGTHNLTARGTDLAGNQTVSAALAVTISGTSPTTNWFDTNIQNAVIRTVGSQEFQDGLIDRNDMINLLRQVETTGSIDAIELSDLTLIVQTTSLFGSLDYVDNLASKIVLGSTANAHYQGGTLGNLTVGSSAAQLELLVDKWFLGTDHPAAESSYQTVTGPLFQNGAAYTDIAQGNLGNCGLTCVLAEIAYRSPATITSMFIVNGDGTYTVRFYNSGKADYVTVDSQLPSGYASTANELWVGLAEKAWAQRYELIYGTNSYSAIAGTFMFDAFGQITGQSTIGFTTPSSDTLTAFVDAFNAGKMIGFASPQDRVPSDGVVPDHTYAVIDYDAATQSVTLFNPWGVGIGNGGLITLTWNQVQADFWYFDRTT
jgi:hypothetical protein